MAWRADMGDGEWAFVRDVTEDIARQVFLAIGFDPPFEFEWIDDDDLDADLYRQRFHWEFDDEPADYYVHLVDFADPDIVEDEPEVEEARAEQASRVRAELVRLGVWEE